MDIPARACTITEFLSTDLLGPYAIFGFLMLQLQWMVSVTPAYLGLQKSFELLKANRKSLAAIPALVGLLISSFLLWVHLSIYL